MRTIFCEADCSSLGAKQQSDLIVVHRSRSNSKQSDTSCDSISLHSISIPSNSNHTDEIADSIEYIYPSDSEDESCYFSSDENNDVFLEKHLNRKNLQTISSFEDNHFQRVKRSNKKLHAQRQIKTKHAKTIKNKSHNKHLYIHHRLAKTIHLDPPSLNYKPSESSVSLYTNEQLRQLIYHYRHNDQIFYDRYLTTRKSKSEQVYYVEESQLYSTNQYREYTLNEFNIPDEPSYDDTMVNFLLEMQTRDLSPEDYEMLLRLDERVERKTVHTNLLDSLPTVDVNDTHLNDQCIICIQNYQINQKLKLLPCTHIFHSECIEKYFKEFSNRCPLDNLPLI